MTDIIKVTTEAYARLVCDARGCEREWLSALHRPKFAWGEQEEWVKPAFAQGWRLYVGARSRFTYCPEHGPKAPMRLIYGQEDRA